MLEQTVLHKVLSSSASNKDAVAIRIGTESISYGELDYLSKQLCYCLIESGVGYQDRVAIYLDKSIEFVIAIFAILRAGAVYVPLDASAPIGRIINIINDCKATSLIGEASNISRLLKKDNVQIKTVKSVIYIGNNSNDDNSIKTKTWDDVLACSKTNMPNIMESDIAYILYTSGSTGMPKGVMISHLAAMTFVNWSYDLFKTSPGEVVANHAPLHFDLSIFDVFTTIKAGGVIQLIPPDISLFPYNLAALIAKEKVNILYLVPSMLVKLILYGQLDKHDFSSIRLVLFAGEVLPVKYLKMLMDKIPEADYYNLYGPTETNVCTYHKVTKIDCTRDAIPIGKECPYNKVILLNQGRILPDEEKGEGELCVKGSNIMKGYWNDPAKTVRSRKPIVFDEASGEEFVYHTGDWVKRDTEGNINYLGRIDGIIKSRGYRIELEEIEATLYKHPSILRAAAVPIPDLENTNLIKAFIVPCNKVVIDYRDIKAFCSKSLPRYMVPQFVEIREQLPETKNGKIDKMILRNES